MFIMAVFSLPPSLLELTFVQNAQIDNDIKKKQIIP